MIPACEQLRTENLYSNKHLGNLLIWRQYVVREPALKIFNGQTDAQCNQPKARVGSFLPKAEDNLGVRI